MFVSKVLGPEGRGDIAQFFAVSTILISCGRLGFSQWIMAESKVTYNMSPFSIVVIDICSLLPIALSLYVLYLLNLVSLPYILVLAIIVYSVLSVAYDLVLALLIAADQQSKYALMLVTLPAIGLSLSLGLYAFDALYLETYLTAIVLAIATSILIGGTFLVRNTRGRKSFPVTQLYDVFKSNLHIYLANVIKDVSYRIDYLLVGYFFGAFQLGIYSLAVALMEMSLKVTDAISLYVLRFAATSWERVTLRYVVTNLGIISFMFAMVYIFGSIVVYNYLGARFELALDILKWLLPACLFVGTWKITVSHAIGRFKGRGYIQSVILSVIVQVGLLFMFRQWGLYGAVLAVTFSYLTMLLVLYAYYRKCVAIDIKSRS